MGTGAVVVPRVGASAPTVDDTGIRSLALPADTTVVGFAADASGELLGVRTGPFDKGHVEVWKLRGTAHSVAERLDYDGVVGERMTRVNGVDWLSGLVAESYDALSATPQPSPAPEAVFLDLRSGAKSTVAVRSRSRLFVVSPSPAKVIMLREETTQVPLSPTDLAKARAAQAEAATRGVNLDFASTKVTERRAYLDIAPGTSSPLLFRTADARTIWPGPIDWSTKAILAVFWTEHENKALQHVYTVDWTGKVLRSAVTPYPKLRFEGSLALGSAGEWIMATRNGTLEQELVVQRTGPEGASLPRLVGPSLSIYGDQVATFCKDAFWVVGIQADEDRQHQALSLWPVPMDATDARVAMPAPARTFRYEVPAKTPRGASTSVVCDGAALAVAIPYADRVVMARFPLP
ncbi:MAG: hypothetical protein HOO96_26435 [Polyangiaceae bacterium]|nr:hypothetical protein [Polyangiaceae bacterium]